MATPIDVLKGYKRTGSFPLDSSDVFATLGDFQTHAMGATAYLGQICAVIIDIPTNVVDIYKIKNITDGTVTNRYESLGGNVIGVTDGDKGDIVISASGTVYTIEAQAVSLSKIVNFGAGQIPYRKIGSGSGSLVAEPIATLVADLAGNGLVPSGIKVNNKSLTTDITLTTADVAASTNKNYVTDSEKTAIAHTNRTALDAVSGTNTGDETTARIGTLVGGATATTAPVDNDLVPITDSTSANILRKFTWANLKARIYEYIMPKFVNRAVPTGAMNGTNTIFTLANTPLAGKEMVFRNGLLQNLGAGNDYTISGATITFIDAPLSTETILVSYWY